MKAELIDMQIALLTEADSVGVALPERIFNWRLWIGDEILYIHELKEFIQRNKKP